METRDLQSSMRFISQRIFPDRIITHRPVAERDTKEITDFAIATFAYGTVKAYWSFINISRSLMVIDMCVSPSNARHLFKVTLTSNDWKWISRRDALWLNEKRERRKTYWGPLDRSWWKFSFPCCTAPCAVSYFVFHFNFFAVVWIVLA